VNTFLPYESYKQSAAVLDMRRLGKQRVEAYQILRALSGLSKGWVNHPCSNIWRGYEPALAQYALVVCVEWRKRGYQDTVYDKVRAMYPEVSEHFASSVRPPIIGREDFHLSHRSNLLRKDFMHYSQFDGFDIGADLPYVWV